MTGWPVSRAVGRVLPADGGQAWPTDGVRIMSRKSNLRPIVVRPIPGYLDEHQPRSTKLPQLKIILEHGRDIHALLTARFDESCPRDDEALDGIGKAVQGVQYGLMIWTLAEWGVDKAKAAADPANTWSRVQVALGGLSEAYV